MRRTAFPRVVAIDSMAHTNSHKHAHAHPHGPDRTRTRRLGLVLALTAAYMVAEVVGGFVSNSLALLADAGHMLTDVLALGVAVFAAWGASRPPDPARTYGYQRIEILAALLNGSVLIVIAAFILLEAWQRLREPPAVEWGLMAGVAAGGLLVNLVALRILGSHGHGLNVRAAYLHVVGDVLGSVGALAAAAGIAAFGWGWADPAASVVISGIIVLSAVRVVGESVHVLLEGAPSHVDTADVRRCLESTAGVTGVHDLHVWTLRGETPLLTAHLVLDHSVPSERVLRDATRTIRERFGIEHATLQLEPPDYNIIQRLGPDS